MRFLSQNVGDLVLQELRKAVEARIAVAFFSPDDRFLAALRAVPRLTLIVSEEFTVNNPYKLEQLIHGTLLSIPPDDEKGKLHAKVLVIKRGNGSYWCLVGSANLTHEGLFSNREACISMESCDPGDEEPVNNVRAWFDTLREVAQSPDIDQAKQVFDARGHYRLEPRPVTKTKNGQRYWALKTTSGSTGEQHWPSLLAENVIAIGWSGIKVDPSKVSYPRLRAAIEETYKDEDANGAANKIKKFVELGIGDVILLCRGYNATQEKDVHIHGFARVTGPFRFDRRSRWWRFKHDAAIQVVNMDFPRQVVASALGKETLMQAIHELSNSGFGRLTKELKKAGVQVEV
jgi:HKD family nuclease